MGINGLAVLFMIVIVFLGTISLNQKTNFEVFDELVEGFNSPVIILLASATNHKISPSEESLVIPEWVRNNAKWWAEGSIRDVDFLLGIQYLIKEAIMQIPETAQTSASEGKEIPSWIKNNADWWSQGLISDDEFVQGIKYLVEHGIIKV